jgi:DNA-directed RNA polymerase specialized sigma24 family protein
LPQDAALIAARRGIEAGTSESQLSRARATIAAQLGPDANQESFP